MTDENWRENGVVRIKGEIELLQYRYPVPFSTDPQFSSVLFTWCIHQGLVALENRMAVSEPLVGFGGDEDHGV